MTPHRIESSSSSFSLVSFSLHPPQELIWRHFLHSFFFLSCHSLLLSLTYMNLHYLGGTCLRTCLSPTSTIVVLMSFALGLRWINLRTIRLPSSVMVNCHLYLKRQRRLQYTSRFPLPPFSQLIWQYSFIECFQT
jgi:hypothetical protein